MPDEKKNDAEEDDGHDSSQDAPGGRWSTDAAGIESIGSLIEIEDLTTPEQKMRNAEAARFKEELLVLARKLAAEIGEDDDDDEGEGERERS